MLNKNRHYRYNYLPTETEHSAAGLSSSARVLRLLLLALSSSAELSHSISEAVDRLSVGEDARSNTGAGGEELALGAGDGATSSRNLRWPL